MRIWHKADEKSIGPMSKLGRLQSRSRNFHIGIQEPAISFGESHAKRPFNSAMPPSKDFAIVPNV